MNRRAIAIILAGWAATGAVTGTRAATLTVTNDLVVWLKADAIPGLTNGQSVARWPDASRHGSDAEQTDSARQPTFIRESPSSRPVVRFDGDRAANGVHADFLTLPGRASESVSVFLVAKPAHGGNSYALALGSNHRGVVFGFETHSTQWNWFNDEFTPLGYLDVSRLQLVACTTASAKVDTAWQLGADIGNTAPFAGDIAEVLIYATALSAKERQAVEDYLAAKWSVSP